jgi:hypothetical protein
MVLAIGGAFAGTAGSIITAFSVNRALTELHLGQRFLGVTLEGLAMNQPNVPIFTGTERRFKNAASHGARLVWLGVALLATGFILQALSVLLSAAE